MSRKRKEKTPFTLNLFNWENEDSDCCKFLISKTEFIKEFKEIWFKNKSYLENCGFSLKEQNIMFICAANDKNKKNINEIRDNIIKLILK